MLALIALGVAGCGGGPRASRDLRERLDSEASAAARSRAPDLVAQVEAALDDADEAEARGDLDAAGDHTTRARLLLDAAEAEAARVADVEARREIEAEVARVLERARRDERARAAIGAELGRLASARAAREEVERALEAATEDEARRPRRGRVSLEETADLRRGAAALRARARTLAAAARAMGADEAALAPVDDALRRSEQSRDPLEALGVADDAHRAALVALGAARAALDGPGADGVAALTEAARAEGFEALALPEGVAVVSDRLFRGAATRPDAALARRLAAVAAAHPHGPIQIQAWTLQRGRAGEALSRRRGEALRAALTAAGVAEDRLTVTPADAALAPDEPSDATRLVFTAYTP